MRIGELAALVGVSTRTVRHYHHLGLLPEPERLGNGYRNYRLWDAVVLARAAMYAMVPTELVLVGLMASGVGLPRLLVAGSWAAASTVLLLEQVVAGRFVVAARRGGDGWRTAFRSARLVLPERACRVLAFDLKGVVSMALLVLRRRPGRGDQPFLRCPGLRRVAVSPLACWARCR